MPSAPLLVAAISLVIWLYLFAARGTFWNLQPFDDDNTNHAAPTRWPSVAAIIPARNEAETIAQTIASLSRQDYSGKFSIVVVDDHSEDATAQLALEFVQTSTQANRTNNLTHEVTILSAPPLQPGWTGKLSALNAGINFTLNGAPDENVSSRAQRGICRSSAVPQTSTHEPPTYFWFTDADVVHAPDTLRRLVSRAEQNDLDLTSLMVLLRAQTLPERFLIPPFLFFFLKLYPPSQIANPNSRAAGAAGGCILLRRTALDRIGGLAAIRSEVIDDCALARAVKRSATPDGTPNATPHPKIWMGVTRKNRSLRAYSTFAEIRDMIARTAFTQLRYSALLLLGTLRRPGPNLPRPHRPSLRTRHRHAPNSALNLVNHVALVPTDRPLLPHVHPLVRRAPVSCPLLRGRHHTLRLALLDQPRRPLERPLPGPQVVQPRWPRRLPVLVPYVEACFSAS